MLGLINRFHVMRRFHQIHTTIHFAITNIVVIVVIIVVIVVNVILVLSVIIVIVVIVMASRSRKSFSQQYVVDC